MIMASRFLFDLSRAALLKTATVLATFLIVLINARAPINLSERP